MKIKKSDFFKILVVLCITSSFNSILANNNYYNELILKHSSQHNLDPDLVKAVIYVESRGKINAVSLKKSQRINAINAGYCKKHGC